jgi:hypothetical protein
MKQVAAAQAASAASAAVRPAPSSTAACTP